MEGVRDSFVWREVARAIADAGAARCFGLAGGANFKVTQALTEFGVSYVAARHEAGAVTMADASSRLSGELVVVSVTAGPGLTNAITGIAECAKSRTPLLVIAGDVARGDVVSAFSMSQSELVTSVGAAFVSLSGASSAYDEVLRLAGTIIAEQRTVVLSLPIDVQEVAVSASSRPAAVGQTAARRAPTDAAVADLVSRIKTAQRPLILAGRGAVIGNAGPDLIALADKTGALLATTVQAHGLFASSEWNLGIAGGFASPAARRLIADSDLILAFGVSLNSWTTNKGRLIGRSAKVVQIDHDASRFGYHRPVDAAICADAGVTAVRLTTALDLRPDCAHAAKWRSAETAEVMRTGTNKASLGVVMPSERFVDPRHLTVALDSLLPRDRTVVSDGGHFVGWAPRYLSVPDQYGWCVPIAFQSIGLGLAAAIGAAVTRPDRLTVLAAGDGGLLMSLAELETAVRLHAQLCIIVYNDQAYGAEVHHFKKDFPASIAQFPEVDFVRIIRGFGGDGVTVRQLDDLMPLASWVRAGANGVFVVDARIDPNLIADWYAEVFAVSEL